MVVAVMCYTGSSGVSPSCLYQQPDTTELQLEELGFVSLFFCLLQFQLVSICRCTQYTVRPIQIVQSVVLLP